LAGRRAKETTYASLPSSLPNAPAASRLHAPLSTLSEAWLFEALRGRRLGVSFKRQVPLLGRYIADLFAPEVRLVVEIDGGYHAERGDADARRQRALERAGYRVVRLDVELVMRDRDAAVARVRAVIAELSG
jgi:very-short-patch-repair endonuclease